MNKIFRVIWNHSTQSWVATSELTKSKGKTKSVSTAAAAVAAALVAMAGDASAATQKDQYGNYYDLAANPGSTRPTGSGTGAAIGNITVIGYDNLIKEDNAGGHEKNIIVGSKNEIGTRHKLKYTITNDSNLWAQGDGGVRDAVVLGRGNKIGRSTGMTVLGTNITLRNPMFIGSGNYVVIGKELNLPLGLAESVVMGYGNQWLSHALDSRGNPNTLSANYAHGTMALKDHEGGGAQKGLFLGSNVSTESVPQLNVTSGKYQSSRIDNAVVLGVGSRVGGSNSVVIGTEAFATARSHTLRDGEKGMGSNAIAIGRKARTFDRETIALGNLTTAYQRASIALGNHSRVLTTKGYNDRTWAENGDVLSNDLLHAAQGGIAIGDRSTVLGTGSVALGQSAVVGDLVNLEKASQESGLDVTDIMPNLERAVAVGMNASAQSGKDTVIGADAETASFITHSHNAGGAQTAVGYKAATAAKESTAVGTESQANSNNSIAIGKGARAGKEGRVEPVGLEVILDSDNDNVRKEKRKRNAEKVAQARKNTATNLKANISKGVESIAIGDNAIVEGNQSFSFGKASNVTGNLSGALGKGNVVAQDKTFVLGNDVTTTQANSVILGNESADRAATAENDATVEGVYYKGFAGVGAPANGVVSVGKGGKERQIINVAAGKIAATSTDAINGSQLYQVMTKLAPAPESAATKGKIDAPSVVTVDGKPTGPGTQFTNATMVTNAINKAGWIAGNSTSKQVDLVTPGDAVNFLNGTGTVSEVTALANSGGVDVKYNIDFGTLSATGGKLADGVANKVADTNMVMSAVNNSGWFFDLGQANSGTNKVNTDGTAAGTTDKLVQPGETVKFIAGANIDISRVGNNFTISAKVPDAAGDTGGTTTGGSYTFTAKADAGAEPVRKGKSLTIKGEKDWVKTTFDSNNQNPIITVNLLKASQPNNTQDAQGNQDGNIDSTAAANIPGVVTAEVLAKTINNAFWRANASTKAGSSGSSTNEGASLAGPGITAVKPGNLVTFEAGDGITINHDAGDSKFTISATPETTGLTNNADGSVNAPATGGTRPDANKLVNASTVQQAINNSGWQVGNTTDKVGVVKPAGRVNFINSETVNSTVTAKGNNVFDVKFDINPAAAPTVNNGALTKPAEAHKAANISTVVDAIQASGWNLQENDVAKDTVNPGDTVNFKNGTTTRVNITSANGVSVVKLEIDPTETTNALKGDITVEGNKAKTGDAVDGKLATTSDVVKAINESGFTLKSSANGGEKVSGDDEVINPGDNVEMIAGKNMTVKQEGNGKITYATKADVEFNSVKFGDQNNPNGPKISHDGDKIKVGKNDGTPTAITNAASGLKKHNEPNNDPNQITTTTPKAGDLVNLNTPDVNDSNVATVGDLRNMGFVVSSKTVNGNVESLAYDETVKNANEVQFVGKDGVVVKGETSGNVRKFTISYTPTEAATETGTLNVVNNKIDTPAAGQPDSNGGKLVNASTVANAVNNVAWLLQGNGKAPTATPADLKDPAAAARIKAGTKVNFVNGEGTTVVAAYDDDSSSFDVKFNVNTTSVVTDADNTGKVKPTENKGGDLVNATKVAEAINAAGWIVTSDVEGTGSSAGAFATSGHTKEDKLITPGNKVTLKAGKNMVVKQTAGDFAFATKDDVQFNNIQLGGDSGPKITNDGNNIKIGDKDGNPTAISNVKNDLAKHTPTDAPDTKKKAGDTLVNLNVADDAPVNKQAATVENLRNMGWVVSAPGNDYAETVKNANEVEFVAAPNSGLTITGKTTDNKRTITIDAATWNLEENPAKPGEIGVVTPDVAAQPGLTKEEAGKRLMNASSIAQAINNSGFTLKTSHTTEGEKDADSSEEEVINPGDNVEMVAGKNLKVKQEADGKVTYSTADNVTFTNIQFGDVNGPKITNDGNKLKIGDKDGNPTSITNVKNNLPDTYNTDAVNKTNQPVTKEQKLPNKVEDLVNNAATVGDILNAGFNLQGNGVAKDFVKPYDTLNFVDGTGTTVTVNTDAEGKVSNIKVDTLVQYTDKDGNPVKVVNGKGYPLNSVVGKDGKVYAPNTPIDPTTGNPAPGTPEAVPSTEAPQINLVNNNNPTDKTPVTLGNVKQATGTLDGTKRVDNNNNYAPVTENAPELATNVSNAINGLADLNNAPNNNALTVADAKNLGWVVSATGNNYADDVRHANEVRFTGKDGVTVNGTTNTTTGVREIEISYTPTPADTSDLDNGTDGKVTNPADGNKLVNASTVQKAINNAGFVATIGTDAEAFDDQAGKADQLVKTGDKLTLKSGKNIKVKQAVKTENGVTETSFVVATADTPEFKGVSIVNNQGTNPVNLTTAAPNTLTLNGDNNAPVTINNVAGHLNGAKKDTQPDSKKSEKPTSLTDADNNNAATLGDVLNAGFNLKNNDEDKDFVRTFDTLDFVNGGNTVAVVDTDTAGKVSKISVNVVGLPVQFTDALGQPVVKVGDKFYHVGADGKPTTNEVAPNTLKTNMINPNAAPNTKGDATQLGNVDSGLKQYKADNNDPNNKIAKNPKAGDLVNLDTADVANNNAATVGDLRNMGWLVSSNKKTGDLANAYEETVKNANEVRFEGTGLATVSGNTTDAGVRVITVDVDAQKVVEAAQLPVVYSKADGTKVFKQGDKFVTEAGETVEPKDVIASMNNGSNQTAPMKLTNVQSSIRNEANDTKPFIENLNAAADNLQTTNNAVNVGDLRNAVNATGFNLSVMGGTNSTKVGPDNKVDLTNTDGNIVITKAADNHNVTFNLANVVNIGGDNKVTIDGDKGTIGGLTNKTFDPNNFTSGQAATEDQLKSVHDSLNTTINNVGFNLGGVAEGGEFKDESTDKRIGKDDTFKLNAGKNIKITQIDDGYRVETTKDLEADTLTLKGKPGENGKDATMKVVDGPAGVKETDPTATKTRIEYQPKNPDGTPNGDPEKLATLKDGLKFKGNAGNTIAKELNETLEIVGGVANTTTTPVSDKNTYVENVDGKLVVKFAETPEFKGVNLKNGDNVVNLNTKSPNTLNLGGTDNKPVTVSNVASNLQGAKPNTTVPTANASFPEINVNEIKDNAATVNDVLNAGWNLQENGTAKDFVKPYDVVNFINGNGTTVNVTTDAEFKVSKIKVDVKLGDNIGVDGNGGLTVATTNLTNAADGKVNTPAEGGKLVNATTVANAINNSGFTLKTSEVTGGKKVSGADEVINPGDTVDMVAGKNMTVKQEANGKITYATAENVSFTSVQFGDNTGPKITNNGGDIKVGDKDGKATHITNVAGNLPDTYNKDAVNQNNAPVTKNQDLPNNASDLVNNAASVGDVLNAGWNLQENGAARDFVKPYDTVNFANGNGTIARVETDSAGKVSNVHVDIKVDNTGRGSHVTVGPNGLKVDVTTDNRTIINNPLGELSVLTTDLTVLPNGQVDEPAEGHKLVNATTVQQTINNSGWIATVGADTADFENGEGKAEQLIKPSNKVTYNAGKNLKVKQHNTAQGTEITYALENKVDLGDDGSIKAGDVEINHNGINAGGKAISNVKAGEKDGDAVNVGQLKGAVNHLNNKINRQGKDLRAGIAGSNAAAGLPQVYIPGKSMVAASAGTFKGQSAVAVGYSRASDNGKLILKLQGNANTRGDVGGSVGVGYQW